LASAKGGENLFKTEESLILHTAGGEMPEIREGSSTPPNFETEEATKIKKAG
jgi:hypothetical protein